MFEIGSYVVYGSSGICKVADITCPNLPGCSKDRMYYVLSPIGTNGSRSFVPVDNTKVIVRRVINKEDALDLIDEIPKIKEIWITNDKVREEKYKEMVRNCDCRQLISLIKTIYERKQERIAQGRKITATDDRYFKLAEDNLYSELGFALGKDKSEIEDFIYQRIEEGNNK